ncbi:hypothetical protein [uncultured Paraglaciecola sp.]|uniref:hypothetical protein n=1 Tax=uncultured Paraglaciecola sp. TaxID=1765024 RepID=UPI00260B0773|nr:hypothetical protein [uncultured Paraglaciecola sp.]
MTTLGKVTVSTEEGLISEELANYLDRASQTPEYTTAQLLAKETQANRDKFLGKKVINTTTGRTLWGGGNSLTSPWVDGSGTTVHTVT